MTDTTQGGADQGAASGSAAGTAKNMASAAKNTLAQDATAFANQAQQKAQDTLEEQKRKATDTLGDFASAIRKAADDLSQNDQSMVSRVVRQGADSLEQLSRSLTDKRPSELLDAARDFGRRNPLAFAGGAVLLGIALGRLVRSSETHGDDDQNEGFYGSATAGQGARGSSYAFGASSPGGSGVRTGLEEYGSTSGQSLAGGVSSTPEATYDATLTGVVTGGTSGAGALGARGDFGTAGGSTPQEGAALTGGDPSRTFQP